MTQAQFDAIVKLINEISAGDNTKIVTLETALKDVQPTNLNEFYDCAGTSSKKSIVEYAVETLLNVANKPGAKLVLDAIDLIVKRGGVLGARNINQVPLLHLVVSKKLDTNTEVAWVTQLIQRFDRNEADFNILEEKSNDTAAHAAVLSGNYDLVPTLHKYGCGLNRCNKDKRTSYDYAEARYAPAEHLDKMRLLGALPGDKASKIAQMQLINRLDKHREKTAVRQTQEFVDDAGATKLKSEPELAPFLITNESPEGKFVSSPPINAIVLDDDEVFSKLIERGMVYANVIPERSEDEKFHNESLAHIAVRLGCVNIVGMLCAELIDLKYRDEQGRTAIDIMIAKGEIAQFFADDRIKTHIQSQFSHIEIRYFLSLVGGEKPSHMFGMPQVATKSSATSTATAAVPAPTLAAATTVAAEKAEQAPPLKLRKIGQLKKDKEYCVVQDAFRAQLKHFFGIDLPKTYSLATFRMATLSAIEAGGKIANFLPNIDGADSKKDSKEQSAATPPQPAVAASVINGEAAKVIAFLGTKNYQSFKELLINSKTSQLNYPGVLTETLKIIDGKPITKKGRITALIDLFEKLLKEFSGIHGDAEVIKTVEKLNSEAKILKLKTVLKLNAAPAKADNKKPESDAPAGGVKVHPPVVSQPSSSGTTTAAATPTQSASTSTQPTATATSSITPPGGLVVSAPAPTH